VAAQRRLELFLRRQGPWARRETVTAAWSSLSASVA
jgi:hypothetical protein